MVRIFSQEEMEKKFDALPDILQDALFDDEIATKMYEIGKKYNLSQDNGKIASAEAGNIVLGLSRPQDFLPRIIERIGLKPAIADALAKDIYISVLKPLAEEIKKAHRFELSESSLSARIEEAQKPQGAQIVLAPRPPAPAPQEPAVRTFGQPIPQAVPRPQAPPVMQKQAPPMEQKAPMRPPLVIPQKQVVAAPRPAPTPQPTTTPPSPRMNVLSGSLKMPEELHPAPPAPKPLPTTPEMPKPPAPPREETRNIVLPQAPRPAPAPAGPSAIPQQPKVFIPRMPTPPRQGTDPYREKVLEGEKEPPQKTDRVEDPRGPQEPFLVKKGELPYTNPKIPPIDLRGDTPRPAAQPEQKQDPYRENFE